MLVEKIKNTADFTTSEKIIGNFILENKEAFCKMTVDEVAQKTYTSKATVTRFCKKIINGKGFQEFKLAFISEMGLVERLNISKGNDSYNIDKSCEAKMIQDIYHVATMKAKNIILIATGANKAQAVMDMIEGSIDEACPASILQKHPNVTVIVDEAAASLLA